MAFGEEGSACRDIAVTPSNANIIYAAGTAGAIKVYRSSNAGNDWNDITGNLSGGFAGERARALLVDRIDPNRVLVGTDQGVFGTTDGGATWLAKGLIADVRDFVRDPNNGSIYAATFGDGVFRSFNDGETWVAMNTGLDCRICLCIGFDPNHRNLFVGTGGGVWRLSTTENAAMPIWRRYQ